MMQHTILFNCLLNNFPCLNSYSISGTTITLSDPADFTTNAWTVRNQIIANGITKIVVTVESGDYDSETIPWNTVEEVDIQRTTTSVFSIDFLYSKILRKVSLGSGVKIISGKTFSRTSM